MQPVHSQMLSLLKTDTAAEPGVVFRRYLCLESLTVFVSGAGAEEEQAGIYGADGWPVQPWYTLIGPLSGPIPS